MKLLVIGATGNMGSTLLKMALSEGCSVTVLVRHHQKLISQLQGCELPLPAIITGDAMDAACVSAASRGQDAVINVAGNVAEGDGFAQLVDVVTRGVEDGLGAGGRFWFFGGAAALDVPGTNFMSVDLPKIPAHFGYHARNYARVKSSSLNWSMLCPGPMIPAKEGKPHLGLRISRDIWPVPRPGYTRYLPMIATSIAFRQAMPELTVCYEDAARVLLDNLEADSPLAKRRVGLALPKGVRQHKDLSPLRLQPDGRP